jgi:hypothetical protein
LHSYQHAKTVEVDTNNSGECVKRKTKFVETVEHRDILPDAVEEERDVAFQNKKAEQQVDLGVQIEVKEGPGLRHRAVANQGLGLK